MLLEVNTVITFWEVMTGMGDLEIQVAGNHILIGL